MKRDAMEQARSTWSEISEVEPVPGYPGVSWARRVGDGTLVAFVVHEPAGWHMSISFRDHRDRPSRYPRWDEIADAREQLLPGDLTFAMILPPSSEYVAVHKTTFHLHEIPGEEEGR